MPLKETIIFAPGANQSDLLKSLAKNNENSFGVRIMNAHQLAEYALMRCGIEVEEEFIAQSNEAMLVYDAIKSTRYFNKYMYLDAWKLMESIDNLRYFIRDNEELFQFVNLLPDENFKEKNDTLRFVFSKYLLVLNEKHLIDEISYIRKAIRECGAIPDVEIKLLKEFPLKPLEEELFRALTNQEPTYSPLGEPDKKLEITTYTKAFGSSNEVENIIKYILKNKIPFDQCLIVTPESKNYPKLFINYRDLFKFSLKEGVSYSIFETNPGKLLALIMSWSRSIFYKSFFVEMIQDSSFDIERFKFDIKFDENNKEIDEINQRLDYLNKITFEKILDAAGRYKYNHPE